MRHAGRRRPIEQILQALEAAVRKVRPDLIHGNSLSMGRITGTLAASTGLVSTAHLRDIVGLSATAVSQLNGNRALVAVSKAVRDFHMAQGVDESRVHVIYNGIGEAADFARPHDRSLTAELSLPADAFLVATIGQIGLRKGQDVFVRAAALASPRMSNAHFLLIGQRYSAKPETVDYDESLDREVRQAGLEGRFHRLGYRPDADRLLGEIDLLVHAARQEPFGRVLLEGAVAGCPIVATAVGGTPEMLVDGQSALLVPPDAPHDLAAAMVRMYEDASLRQRLADAAKLRVTTLFPVERASRKLADLWRLTLAK